MLFTETEKSGSGLDVAADSSELLSGVLNLRFPWNLGISWMAEQLSDYQEGLPWMELVTCKLTVLKYPSVLKILYYNAH